MSKKNATLEVPATVNSTVVTAYQAISKDTEDLNQAGLDLIVLLDCEMSAGRLTGRELRASIEQVGINPLVAIKFSHAEIIPTAREIIAKVTDKESLIVSKVLSLATRVKRAGVELTESTYADLDENTPTIKEIAESKKENKEEEGAAVEVALPELDALLLEFVANLKKVTKKNLQGMEFGDIATPALEELKVIMGQLAKNKKASIKK
jgi:isopenicillin N synthase-like dioxygenase